METTSLLFLVLCASMVEGWPFERQYDNTTLGETVDRIAMRFTKEMYDMATDKNIVASPLAVQMLLALYSEGAGRIAKAEIDALLGITKSMKSKGCDYAVLNRHLPDDPSYFVVANKIFVGTKGKVKTRYLWILDRYKSQMSFLDFRLANAAAETINEWAADKTQDHIQNIVSPKGLGSDTSAAILNIIFFKGHWHVPFETVQRSFHVNKETTVQKRMLNLRQPFFYFESIELGARLLELPFEEYHFRMVIVLPKEVEGLSDVLHKVARNGLYMYVRKLNEPCTEIELCLPKIHIETRTDLACLLPRLGVSKIFTEPATGILRDKSVVVSKAFQKASVVMDQVGVTGATFTGVTMPPPAACIPPCIEYHVDRPFLFVIIYDDVVLFTGTHAR